MKTIIVLSSITYALKAQELLKKEGIFSKISRSKSVRSIRSCGYGVALSAESAEKANQIILSANIPIVGSTEEK